MAIELSPSSADFDPKPDRRARIEEPLPVRLIAVADMRLPAPHGLEAFLDRLYIDLLGFVRDAEQAEIAYHADNFCLVFELTDKSPVPRAGFRAVGIEVQSLSQTERQLMDGEIEYERRRGVTPGTESLWLYDPAGNPLEIVERREVG